MASRLLPSLRIAMKSTLVSSMKMPVVNIQGFSSRRWASGGALNRSVIYERIEDVLKSFDRVNPEQITQTASFVEDLGLDSLDTVEAIMAIEEEFSIEIPDEEADQIRTIKDAIDYVANSPAAS